MTERVRVGVIGLGVGRHHVEAYRRTAEAELVALADANETLLRQRQREYGVETGYTDYRALLERPDIEAVSVAVPNDLHRQVVLDALAAGKHVLCEKPLARTVAEGREIALAVRQSGRVFLMAFNNRFRPESQLLKRLVEEGVFGDLYYLTTGWLRRRWILPRGSWFGYRERSGGGPLIDLGVHMLDLALWLAGFPPVRRVVGFTHDRLARARATPEDPVDVEDFAAATVFLETGAVLHLATSWVGHIEARDRVWLEVLGTQAGASLVREVTLAGTVEERCALHEERHGVALTSTPLLVRTDPALSTYQESILNEVRHFLQCILTGQPPIAPVEHGLRVLEVLEAIYQAAAAGREIEPGQTAAGPA